MALNGAGSVVINVRCYFIYHLGYWHTNVCIAKFPRCGWRPTPTPTKEPGGSAQRACPEPQQDDLESSFFMVVVWAGGEGGGLLK